MVKVGVLRASLVGFGADLCAALRRQAAEPHLLYLRYRGFQDEIPGSWRAEELAVLDDWRRHRPLRTAVDLWGYLRRASSVAQRERYDVLVAVKVFPCGWAALRARRRAKVPYVVLCVGWNDIRSSPGEGRVVGWARPRVLRGAARVFVVTEAMAQEVRKTFPGVNPLVLPNPVDVARFERADRSAARHELGLSIQTPAVVCVAHYEGVKGQAHLIEAFARLRHRDADLYLIGGGSQEAAYASLIRERGLSDRVHLMGKQPPERIPMWLWAADLFALPSLSEGFPLAVLEAMAAGLPVVATNIPGIPEVLAEGRNALLVPPADPDALAGAIDRLLDDEALARAMATANRQDVRRYGWDDYARRLLQEAANLARA